MLNRTNRTLAHLDRMNLGTRSLAVEANVVNVAITLRAADTHPHDAIVSMSPMRGAKKPAGAIPEPIGPYRGLYWFPSRSFGGTRPDCPTVVSRWVEVVAEQPPVPQEVIAYLPSGTRRGARAEQASRWRAATPLTLGAQRAPGMSANT